MKGKKNSIDGLVYSTNKELMINNTEKEQSTLPAEKQNLRLRYETKHRAGKPMTIVTGFIGTVNDLEALAKLLKVKCGVGGSAKDGEVLLQGDVREKVKTLLLSMHYKIK